MFFKALFGSGRPASSGSFWQNFACIVQPLREENGERRRLFTFARASFEETSPYNYSLVLENLDKAGQFHRFALSANMRVTLTSQRNSAVFELMETFTSLVLEFPMADENYDSAGLFREVLGRLLFQIANKRSAEDCHTIVAEVSRRIEVVAGFEAPTPSDKLLNVIRNYTKAGILFLAAGQWGTVNVHKKRKKRGL